MDCFTKSYKYMLNLILKWYINNNMLMLQHVHENLGRGWREGDTRPGPSSMSIQSRNCLRAMNTLQLLHETKCFLKRPKGHLNHQLSWLLSRDIKPYSTYFVLPIIQGWKVHCFQDVSSACWAQHCWAQKWTLQKGKRTKLGCFCRVARWRSYWKSVIAL